jgi:DNA-directed RNA polymerase
MLDFENRGVYWTSVDIANHFGLDKSSFADRVQWVKDNLDNLESFSSEADSQYEFNKAVKALRIYQQGKLPAHMVYLDASNQALQLYAVLTGDKKTASTCNLANGSIMADAYKLLAKAMNKYMELNCFTRSICKKALMTTMYGKADAYTEMLSTMYPRSSTPSIDFEEEYKRDVVIDKESTAVYPEHMSMQDAFNEAMKEIAPKAIVAMDAIQALNDEKIGTYYWELPDGFRVKYDVKVEVEINFYDVTKKGIQVEVTGMKEVYRPDKGNRGMAPNVIHSVDGYIARQLIKRMNAQGKFITTIHDAFACLPEDCDLMRSIYSDLLIELLESDLLNNILTQIANTNIGIMKTGDLLAQDIRNSEYFLG